MFNGIHLNKIYIDGSTGKYDKTISNSSIRYGRNAIDNFKNYINNLGGNIKTDFEIPKASSFIEMSEDEFTKTLSDLESLSENFDMNFTPTNFELRYSETTNGQIDKMSLMGAAYEEMDQRTEIPVQEIDKSLKETFGNEVGASALDLNKDEKIDIAEYATSILLNDSLSDYDGKIDGTITNKGQNEGIAYALNKNYTIANAIYRSLYQDWELKKAKNEFIAKLNGINVVK